MQRDLFQQRHADLLERRVYTWKERLKEYGKRPAKETCKRDIHMNE